MLTTLSTELNKAGHKTTAQSDKITVLSESKTQKLGFSLSGLEMRFKVKLRWDKALSTIKIINHV
jgi:hypothetical protein